MVQWIFRLFVGLVLLVIAVTGIGFGVLWHQAGEAIRAADVAPDHTYSKDSAAFLVLKRLEGDTSRDDNSICPALSGLVGNAQSSPAARALSLEITEHQRPESTFSFALRRLFITCRLERQYTGDALLGAWLDRVYVGAGEYGVAAAADSLYGTPFDQLDEDRAIMIAALIRNPGTRDAPDKLMAHAAILHDRLSAEAR